MIPSLPSRASHESLYSFPFQPTLTTSRSQMVESVSLWNSNSLEAVRPINSTSYSTSQLGRPNSSVHIISRRSETIPACITNAIRSVPPSISIPSLRQSPLVTLPRTSLGDTVSELERSSSNSSLGNNIRFRNAHVPNSIRRSSNEPPANRVRRRRMTIGPLISDGLVMTPSGRSSFTHIAESTARNPRFFNGFHFGNGLGTDTEGSPRLRLQDLDHGLSSSNQQLQHMIITDGIPHQIIEILPIERFRPDQIRTEEQSICLICQFDYTEGEEFRRLPCLHHFHPECIDQWLLNRVSCPVCRLSVLSGIEQCELDYHQRTILYAHLNRLAAIEEARQREIELEEQRHQAIQNLRRSSIQISLSRGLVPVSPRQRGFSLGQPVVSLPHPTTVQPFAQSPTSSNAHRQREAVVTDPQQTSPSCSFARTRSSSSEQNVTLQNFDSSRPSGESLEPSGSFASHNFDPLNQIAVTPIIGTPSSWHIENPSPISLINNRDESSHQRRVTDSSDATETFSATINGRHSQQDRTNQISRLRCLEERSPRVQVNIGESRLRATETTRTASADSARRNTMITPRPRRRSVNGCSRSPGLGFEEKQMNHKLCGTPSPTYRLAWKFAKDLRPISNRCSVELGVQDSLDSSTNRAEDSSTEDAHQEPQRIPDNNALESLYQKFCEQRTISSLRQL